MSNKRSKPGYSAVSEIAKEVCEALSIEFSDKKIKALKRGDNIYVKSVIFGSIDHVWLSIQCEKHGFIDMD